MASDPTAAPMPSAWTRAAYLAGTLGAAACLGAGIGLRLLGASVDEVAPFDVAGIVGSVAGLRPTGWATLGVWLLLATPVAGLCATALEARRADRWVGAAALAVLAVLAMSLVIALR